jgi:hypothetical protein
VNIGVEVVVLVVILLVWIVSYLVRQAEDAKDLRRRQLPGRGQQTSESPARRPVSDIDRFLEEVQRRRRQGSEQRPIVVREKPSDPTPVLPPPSPRGTRVQTRGQSRRPAVASVPVPPAASRDTGRARLLEAAVVLEAQPVQPDAPLVQTSAASLGFPPQPAAPVSVITEPSFPALESLTALLRSPESLSTAIVLREVLDQPLCRRHGLR